jgi:hypothetical protein
MMFMGAIKAALSIVERVGWCRAGPAKLEMHHIMSCQIASLLWQGVVAFVRRAGPSPIC